MTALPYGQQRHEGSPNISSHIGDTHRRLSWPQPLNPINHQNLPLSKMAAQAAQNDVKESVSFSFPTADFDRLRGHQTHKALADSMAGFRSKDLSTYQAQNLSLLTASSMSGSMSAR
jgi:hypothetical protein